MAENDFEKTEAPTPRRLQEARRDGNVARSTDLTAACVLLVGIMLLLIFGEQIFGNLKRSIEQLFDATYAGNLTRTDDLGASAVFWSRATAMSLLPLLLGIFAVALVATLSQVGFLVTVKPLVPRLDKLSPLKGFRNLFSARSGGRLAMSLLKIMIIAVVAALAIFGDLDRMIYLVELQTRSAMVAAAGLIFSLSLKLAAVLIVLALIDFAFQRWQRQRELRMSKHEVKQEMKQFEGDPLVKQRRVRVARQLALQRIASAVPKADVVVTNPTHFAVALQYDSQAMRAPRVIAKGADFMAMRIRQIAVLNNLPIVERKPLAQALYRGVEIGQDIPPEHYAAVAEILAYVYRLNGQAAAVA